MFDEETARFPHRSNKDGSFDSICPSCLATIICVRHESELSVHEDAHVCDPVRLTRIGKLMCRYYTGASPALRPVSWRKDQDDARSLALKSPPL